MTVFIEISFVNINSFCTVPSQLPYRIKVATFVILFYLMKSRKKTKIRTTQFSFIFKFYMFI